MRFDGIQNSFTAGEISPSLFGRSDLEKYLTGLAIAENVIVQPEGGVIKRGGSHYIAEVKNSSKATILVEFSYKNQYSYTLEFGNLYIRVYVNKTQVQNGGSSYEITTTYTDSEVGELRFTQESDTFYIVHKDHPPAKLTRSDHDNWTLANISFTFDSGHAWTANDYPTLTWFFEQRHFFASTPTKLNGVWGSRSADYTNMTLGTGLDDEGIEIVVKAATKFLWSSSGQEILLGGSNAEFKISTNSLNEAMTPSNIRAVPHTSYGSSLSFPARIDEGIVFVTKGKRNIRRLVSGLKAEAYSGTYTASNIMALSKHITKSGIINLVYSTAPDSIIWGIREDGVLIGVSYEPEHNVYGWHRHIIGGADVIVKSIAVSKAVEDTDNDELWLIVERTIDGSTVQYIEYIDKGLSIEDDLEDSFFVDSGITATGSGLTLVANLDHLEGEEVNILGDGAKQTSKTVSGGEVILDTPADKVHVGLPYSGIIETLPIEGGNPIGTSQTLIKRIKNTSLRLDRSVGFKIGNVHGDLDEYYFGPPVMDEATPLFTGDTEPTPFSGGYDKQSRLRIESNDPLPFNLLAIIYRARTE